jgi:hypothetical protein
MNANFANAVRLQQRRTFLGQSCRGLGALALASLFQQAQAAGTTGALAKPHVKPKAKRVIFLVMAGGPSHLELYDHKPVLAKMNGKPMPDSITKGQPIAQLQGAKLQCLGPQWGFKKHGKGGIEMNELFTHLPTVADDLCVIRSMKTEAINHDPAHTFMNTGSSVSGRPSMGSWVTYGLGSETEDLPGFVVLTSSRGGQMQPIASRQWSAGFLPGKFQGVHLRGQGDPVLYLTNPPGVNRDKQKDVIDAVSQLDQLQNGVVDDPEIATRISQYELAFKMQASVPALMDIAKEPKAVLESYGVKGADGSFASNCLLARRLAQQGVRFIQLYNRDWDHHGGVKGGVTHGATDDFGYHAAENVVEVYDLHATMLHLLGVDHERLTFRFQGRDYRLTDVHGKLVKPILA